MKMETASAKKTGDVFTKTKRSEVMSRIRSRGSESLEVEVVAADAEVFDDVGDDAAGHVARMPRKCDKPVGAKSRVKGFASRGGEHRTSNIEHPTSNRRQKDESSRPVKKLKPFWELRILRRGLRDGASGFEQGFQVRLGGLLESKGGLATRQAVFNLCSLRFLLWKWPGFAIFRLHQLRRDKLRLKLGRRGAPRSVAVVRWT
jgi:hypothetical protein